MEFDIDVNKTSDKVFSMLMNASSWNACINNQKLTTGVLFNHLMHAINKSKQPVSHKEVN